MPHCCPCHDLFCRPVILDYIFYIALGISAAIAQPFSLNEVL
jgi:hypothetical protein